MTTYQRQSRQRRQPKPASDHGLGGARLAILYVAVAAALGPGAMRAAAAQETQSGAAVGQTAGERQRQGQEPLPPGAARDLPPKEEEQTPSPQNLRWGSFLVYPQVVLSALYDDNIYATRSNEKSDNVGILTPSIRLKSDWTRHKLDFNAGAELSRYVRYPGENTSDYWANADGRYDISGKSNVFGGVGYSREHEDRTSPDAVNGTEPTRYNVGSAYGGVYHNFGRAALRFGGTYEKLDFKDVPSLLGGVINNQDRNRAQTGVGARLSYNLQQGTQVYLQAATNRRRYDNTPDDNGFDRNSDGYSIAVGAKRALGESAQIDGYVGYLRQNYDDPQFTDVTTPDFQARLRWNPTSKTKVTAYLNRSIEETTVNNASGYVYTRGSVRAEHALRPDLSVHVLAFAGRADYNDLERTDDIYVSGVGAKYRLTRRWFLETDYRWINRDSTDLASNYHKNQIFVRLRGLMYPAEKLQRPLAESAAFPLASAASYPGFYVGGQVGFGALNSDADGTRGGASGSNTDIATMGGLGPSEGLFAGWGFTHDRWYLGLELEAGDSQADWYHSKDKTGGRTFSVDKNRSYGASARLGYVLRNGALFYGRLGGVRTTFHTYYTQSGSPAGLTTVDQDFKQNGLRYGLGLEIPAGEHAFWRMDYTYTAYKDYNVDYGVDLDNFKNNESLFRLGLGWRFGQPGQPQSKPERVDYSGFYAGGQLGYGELQTPLNAINNDGGTYPCTNCQLIADFGHNNATAGVFAGYGIEFDNHLYLGVELETEGSHERWTHERGTGGRDFSVHRNGGYGAGARIGYALSNGSLLYARVGGVRSTFNTIYNKGNVANWIDRSDKISGVRYGIGAEVPASRHAFLRMDYSYTNYDSYGFTTAHANADTVRFDNRESLFRLGLGWRF